jgi:hypothetical protein
MAGAIEGEELKQRDIGLFQKPSKAEPPAQHENHGTN